MRDGLGARSLSGLRAPFEALGSRLGGEEGRTAREAAASGRLLRARRQGGLLSLLRASVGERRRARACRRRRSWALVHWRARGPRSAEGRERRRGRGALYPDEAFSETVFPRLHCTHCDDPVLVAANRERDLGSSESVCGPVATRRAKHLELPPHSTLARTATMADTPRTATPPARIPGATGPQMRCVPPPPLVVVLISPALSRLTHPSACLPDPLTLLYYHLGLDCAQPPRSSARRRRQEGRRAQLGTGGRSRRQQQHDDAPVHRRGSWAQDVRPLYSLDPARAGWERGEVALVEGATTQMGRELEGYREGGGTRSTWSCASRLLAARPKTLY